MNYKTLSIMYISLIVMYAEDSGNVDCGDRTVPQDAPTTLAHSVLSRLPEQECRVAH